MAYSKSFAFSTVSLFTSNTRTNFRPAVMLRRLRSAKPLHNQKSFIAASATPASSNTATEAKQYPLFESLFTEPQDAQVLSPNGEKVSLIEYVNGRTTTGDVVLLGWLRHFGCTLCVKQAADWRDLLPELRNAGTLSVALIGNGPPEHAVSFKEQLQWDGDLFTDPLRKTYDVLKFRKGVSSTFTLPALGKVITSFREGNKQTLSRIPTDAFQQGGALLIDRNRCVQLYHVDSYAGDHFDTDKLVEKVKALL